MGGVGCVENDGVRWLYGEKVERKREISRLRGAFCEVAFILFLYLFLSFFPFFFCGKVSRH